MPETPTADDYALKSRGFVAAIAAPELDYGAPDPKAYRPGIGLIGCGGISEQHLDAYQRAGYRVLALCDRHAERARRRQAQFYPEADLYTDHRVLLGREDIAVVDIATHPEARAALIEDAVRAGKHVLSQKPFVLDLDEGERLAALAERQGVRLAVNQNGRWAPHFRYIHQAAQAGLLGELVSAHCGVHWDHSWVMGTPFEAVDDLVLFDFAIHWFDFLSALFGGRPARRVFATRAHAAGQRARPPLLAQALVEFDGAQASLVFDGGVPFGPADHTYVAGTAGTLTSRGPSLGEQTVTLSTAAGSGSPALTGTWFPQGFHGAMGELLCAIEEGREPSNGARDNLTSLALCFAAIASAHDGLPRTPGQVRRLPEKPAGARP